MQSQLDPISYLTGISVSCSTVEHSAQISENFSDVLSEVLLYDSSFFCIEVGLFVLCKVLISLAHSCVIQTILYATGCKHCRSALPQDPRNWQQPCSCTPSDGGISFLFLFFSFFAKTSNLYQCIGTISRGDLRAVP